MAAAGARSPTLRGTGAGADEAAGLVDGGAWGTVGATAAAGCEEAGAVMDIDVASGNGGSSGAIGWVDMADGGAGVSTGA